MGHLTAPPNAVVPENPLGGSVPTHRLRRRSGAASRDSEPDAKRVRFVDRIPGVRRRTPRRNALVALAYLLVFVILVGLFGRLLELVPLPVPFVVVRATPV